MNIYDDQKKIVIDGQTFVQVPMRVTSQSIETNLTMIYPDDHIDVTGGGIFVLTLMREDVAVMLHKKRSQ
jgi:hypothetical protein